jgi:uncharacterized membrane protein YjjP (DUF1212 family)
MIVALYSSRMQAVAVAKLSPAEVVEYLLDLGGALLSYGCATHRLEDLIARLAAQEGYHAEAFAIPTGLFLSLVPPPGAGARAADAAPLVRMVRVRDWAADLERLALIDRVVNDVLERKLTLAEARRFLDHIETKPPAYPLWVRWLAAAGGAGAAAVFFRGAGLEIAVAAIGGLLVGVLGAVLGRSSRTALLADFAGAVVAAAIAWAATAAAPLLSRETIVLSVVILLVPGMALTTGLSELVNKNLVSGAARLMEAFTAFLSIVFGIAMVVGLERLLGLRTVAVPPHGEPALWLDAAALVVASASFGVIFTVPRKQLPAAMASGALGWVVTGLGGRFVPGSLTAFAAALAVGLYANLAARIANRPSQLFLLPGLVLLVPGSFGFVSLESFLHGQFLDGAAKGFEMFLTAGAIVIGLLVADVVLPSGKVL